MAKKFSVHDVLGSRDDDEDDKETRYGVGGSARGGGSDQQVMGWGKDEWDRARKDGQTEDEFRAAQEGGDGKDFRFKIIFWKSPPGQTYFSVNDGPLRMGTDPADQAFLKAIDERHCPDELAMQCQGKEPVVDLIDKRSEEYKAPPKPQYVAFSGDGMSLGGGAKVVIDESAPVMEVDYNFVLDESAKTTKLQLNFHDGSKKIQKFNLTHTVQDIRLFMESEKPLPFGTTYELRTAYDKRLLDDSSLTITDAKLKGESLIQNLTG